MSRSGVVIPKPIVFILLLDDNAFMILEKYSDEKIYGISVFSGYGIEEIKKYFSDLVFTE